LGSVCKPSRSVFVCPTDTRLVGAMFLTVESLKSTPWSEVKALMDEHRLVLGRIDSQWMDD
jgi:hypothetical protein